MAAHSRQFQRTVARLVQLSLQDDQVSASRVDAVVQALRARAPSDRRALLRAYRQALRREITRREALIEHAGPLPPEVPGTLAQSLSVRYGRALQPVTRARPDLIAGLRVRVGDDLYDSSLAGRLARLAEGARAQT